jgi:hypothetical protein
MMFDNPVTRPTWSWAGAYCCATVMLRSRNRTTDLPASETQTFSGGFRENLGTGRSIVPPRIDHACSVEAGGRYGVRVSVGPRSFQFPSAPTKVVVWTSRLSCTSQPRTSRPERRSRSQTQSVSSIGIPTWPVRPWEPSGRPYTSRRVSFGALFNSHYAVWHFSNLGVSFRGTSDRIDGGLVIIETKKGSGFRLEFLTKSQDGPKL